MIYELYLPIVAFLCKNITFPRRIYFSFPKLSFIEYHTIISEVCFNNREFHSSILGVIFGVILNFLSTFLRFLSSFSVYFIELLSTFSVYIFAIMTTIFII